ncbi:MAG: hypothetical protein ABI780_08985 [Ardenticatenales bacterium]
MATASGSGKQNTALQIIFSIFLGIMITAFVGVGVYTFYPQPANKTQDQLQELYRQQQDIESFKAPTALTDADRAKLTAVQADIRTLEDRQKAETERWGRNTSIILILFATLVMAISLVRADQLPVISNGLLLGGVFTMIYGVGWIVATGTSYARFAVMTVALIITLVLGYIRFVWRRQAGSGGAVGGAVPIAGSDLAAISARLDALEGRVANAAAALDAPRS